MPVLQIVFKNSIRERFASCQNQFCTEQAHSVILDRRKLHTFSKNDNGVQINSNSRLDDTRYIFHAL